MRGNTKKFRKAGSMPSQHILAMEKPPGFELIFDKPRVALILRVTN
jgi:hypothetical protein